MRARVWLFSSILLWPLQASAAPNVSWSAPADCPSASEARAEISQLLRRQLASLEVELAADVTIARAANKALAATISIRSGSNSRKRVLSDPDCRVLTRAAAVVVALAIDPTARVPAAEPTPAPSAAAATGPATASASERTAAAPAAASVAASTAGTATTAAATRAGPNAATSVAAAPIAASDNAALSTPASETESSAAAPPAETPQPTAAQSSDSASLPNVTHELPAQNRANSTQERSGISITFALGAGVEFGVLPGAAPTFRASIGLLGSAWFAALHFGYAPYQHATLPEPAGVGGRVALAHAAADGGLRWRWGQLEVPIALGFETGWFTAAGEGKAVTDQQTKSALWLATYLGSGIAVVWGSHFSLGLRLEGLIALERPSFAVEDRADPDTPKEFHRPSTFGARGFVEFELRLP